MESCESKRESLRDELEDKLRTKLDENDCTEKSNICYMYKVEPLKVEVESLRRFLYALLVAMVVIWGSLPQPFKIIERLISIFGG